MHLTKECAVDRSLRPRGRRIRILSILRSTETWCSSQWLVECLRLRKEVWNADAALAKIIEHRISFSDVHDYPKVWPHNMNLGHDGNGDVVRYERWVRST